MIKYNNNNNNAKYNSNNKVVLVYWVLCLNKLAHLCNTVNLPANLKLIYFIFILSLR